MIRYIPNKDNEYGIDVSRLLQLKSKYLQLSPIKDNRSFYLKKDIIYKYLKKDKLDEFSELIDIIYEITQEEDKYYLTRDLMNAKEDCLLNMKYFMNSEEINKFKIEYENAVLEKKYKKNDGYVK